MIDPTLLRRLGWQEDLIDEVTRGAEALRRTQPADLTPPPEDHSLRTHSGNALHVHEVRVASGSTLPIRRPHG